MKKRVFYALFALIATGCIMLGANSLFAADGDRVSGGMSIHGQNCTATEFQPVTVRLGKPAPDFNLEAVVSTQADKEFKQVSLKDFQGKWLILFFYPADFTFVCPTEIKGFNEALGSFKKLDAEVVGVSTDSKWSHLAWLKRGDLGDLKFPLLADFNKVTSRKYNVLDLESGVAQRGLFIIDPQGVLQYQVVHNNDVGRSVEETLRVLEALQTGGLCPLGWKPGQKTLGR